MSAEQPRALKSIYRSLLDHYGPQSWWPGDSCFEIMVGAVLTQNTAWSNVEKAIANLKRSNVLDANEIMAMEEGELAEMIRPAGYFNIKAKRLKNLVRFTVEQGGEAGLAEYDTGVLRDKLLEVNGVGPETADDILLYGFSRPVFVVDAYTRRIFSRYGVIGGKEPYENLRALFETSLGSDARLFNEYHALIVSHAKEVCSKKPDCTGCVIGKNCRKIIK
jgi:endonuclease-3 related protein